jgi:hypothetical protein
MDYNIVWKTVLAQFLNTTIVTFAIRVIPIIYALNVEAKDRQGVKFSGENIWGKVGLLNLVYTLFFNNIFITIGMRLFDYMYLLNVFKRWRTEKAIKAGTCRLTEEEAHAIFRLPPTYVALSYVFIVKTMLFTMFYQSIMPIAAVYTIITFIGIYWIDKVKSLLRS